MATDIAAGYPGLDHVRPTMLEAAVRVYVRYLPALFFCVVLFSCDVDFYIGNFRLYGLGLALNLVWFVFNLIVVPTPFDTRFRFALAPFAGLVAAMLLWSVVFQINTGANFIFSFAALRQWLMFLIAPNIYLAYRIGVPLERMARAFLFALLCVWVIFLCVFLFVPLEVYANSPDPAVARLVARDWRGIRPMVFPLAMLIFSVCYVLGLFIRRRFSLTYFEALFAACTVAMFWMEFSRFISLAVFCGTLAYVLGRPYLRYLQRYLPLLISVFLAMFAMMILFVVVTALSFISTATDLSYLVRLNTFVTVIQGIIAHPVFGLGQASNYSISQQQLFGATFNSVDAGIFGLIFSYGAIGFLAFMAVTVYGLRCSIRAYLRSGSSTRRLMGALLHYSLVLLFLAVFSPLSIDRYGVPMMGCTFGFAMVLLWPKDRFLGNCNKLRPPTRVLPPA